MAPDVCADATTCVSGEHFNSALPTSLPVTAFLAQAVLKVESSLLRLVMHGRALTWLVQAQISQTSCRLHQVILSTRPKSVHQVLTAQ